MPISNFLFDLKFFNYLLISMFLNVLSEYISDYYMCTESAEIKRGHQIDWNCNYQWL